MPEEDRHRELMRAAIEHDREAQEALLSGDGPGARAAFLSAADLYRQSWEAAPPTAYGRLVGMLKSAILGGEGRFEAQYARQALEGAAADSATAAYALALAALLLHDDNAAIHCAAAMRAAGGEAFDRAGTSIEALASGDREAFDAAQAAIVRDFEARTEHLTGIGIADTALTLETLGAARGLHSDVASPLLPRL